MRAFKVEKYGKNLMICTGNEFIELNLYREEIIKLRDRINEIMEEDPESFISYKDLNFPRIIIKVKDKYTENVNIVAYKTEMEFVQFVEKAHKNFYCHDISHVFDKAVYKNYDEDVEIIFVRDIEQYEEDCIDLDKFISVENFDDIINENIKVFEHGSDKYGIFLLRRKNINDPFEVVEIDVDAMPIYFDDWLSSKVKYNLRRKDGGNLHHKIKRYVRIIAGSENINRYKLENNIQLEKQVDARHMKNDQVINIIDNYLFNGGK